LAIIPGVIDSTTNFVEHPELVAQRIVRYAEVVGRENVIAGTDCGFGTFVRAEPTIDPRIAWAKLKSLAEGAAIASKNFLELAGIKSLGQLRSHPCELTLTFLVSGLKASTSKVLYKRSVTDTGLWTRPSRLVTRLPK
jgi:hypothetical protein